MPQYSLSQQPWGPVLDSFVSVAGLLFAGSEKNNWAELVLAALAQARGSQARGSPGAEGAAMVSRQSVPAPFISSRSREQSLQTRP